MLVIFSGGSGVGKNTVIEKLLGKPGFALMPTYTTRAQRKYESPGNPYFFITEEEFQEKLTSGEFYEYQVVHNHFYGTSKTLLENGLATGKILLKDIDVLGTQNLVNTVGKDVKIVTFFLKVNSIDILTQRLKQRGENDIELRLNRYALEKQYETNYDYIITNENLNETLEIVNDIINLEKGHNILHSTQGPRELYEDKVYSIAKALKDGEKMPSIKVAIRGHELFIIDGHHRYLASLYANKKVAKEIISVPYIDNVEQYSWEDIIEFCTRK